MSHRRSFPRLVAATEKEELPWLDSGLSPTPFIGATGVLLKGVRLPGWYTYRAVEFVSKVIWPPRRNIGSGIPLIFGGSMKTLFSFDQSIK